MLKKKAILISFCSLLFFSLTSDASAAVAGTNKAIAVICDIILLIRGRIGRAIVVIAVFNTAWTFINGSVKWQQVVTICVGAVLLFGAEGFAYIILPKTFKGVAGTSPTGKVFDLNKEYNPEEIMRESCPELAKY